MVRFDAPEMSFFSGNMLRILLKQEVNLFRMITLFQLSSKFVFYAAFDLYFSSSPSPKLMCSLISSSLSRLQQFIGLILDIKMLSTII